MVLDTQTSPKSLAYSCIRGASQGRKRGVARTRDLTETEKERGTESVRERGTERR